jgi:hypothetical protein
MDPNYGCMNWAWSVQCDLQLHLFVPLCIYCFCTKKGHAFGFKVMNWVIFLGMCFNAWYVWESCMKPGLPHPPNINFYTEFFSKPWTRIDIVALGVVAARLYCDLLDYRECSPEQKWMKHPKIHKLHQNPKISRWLFLFGLALVFTDLIVGRPQKAAPWEKIAFFSLLRLAYCFGVLLTLLPMVLGHFNIGMRFMLSGHFKALGKLTLTVSLLHPVALALLFYTVNYSMHLTFIVITYLAFGIVVVSTVIGLLAFILFDYPMQQTLKLLTLGKLDHPALKSS